MSGKSSGAKLSVAAVSTVRPVVSPAYSSSRSSHSSAVLSLRVRLRGVDGGGRIRFPPRAPSTTLPFLLPLLCWELEEEGRGPTNADVATLDSSFPSTAAAAGAAAGTVAVAVAAADAAAALVTLATTSAESVQVRKSKDKEEEE